MTVTIKTFLSYVIYLIFYKVAQNLGHCFLSQKGAKISPCNDTLRRRDFNGDIVTNLLSCLMVNEF